MNALLGELGSRLADKWVTLLVLPGLLYVGVVAAGTVLGHGGWADVGRLGPELERVTTSGTLALVIGVVLLTAAVGVAAQGLGTLVERVWFAERWHPPFHRAAGWLVRHRSRRWTTASDAYLTAKKARADIRVRARHGHPDLPPEPDTAALGRARDRIALAEPRCPTWIGDRLLAADTRVHRAYDLDLGAAWPVLWLVCPQESRDQVDGARSALGQAAGLTAWGVLYALAGVVWWPAALAGTVLVLHGRRRGRAAVDVYAGLVEGVVDLYGRDLAVAMGFDCTRFTAPLGREITVVLRKDDTKH